MSQQKTPHGKLTLYYFPGAGRAQAIRDTLRIGGVPFEDVHLPFPEFMARRQAGTLPFGALPVLHVERPEGTVIVAQSNAILAYAGRLAGLYPTEAFEALRVDEILGAVEDVGGALGPSMAEQDMTRKLAMRAELCERVFPRYLSGLERLLGQPGVDGFFVGGRLTVADLKVLHALAPIPKGALDGVPKDLLASYPRLDAFMARAQAARDAALAAAG